MHKGKKIPKQFERSQLPGNDISSVQVCIEHTFQNVKHSSNYDIRRRMENNENKGITLLLRSEIT